MAQTYPLDRVIRIVDGSHPLNSTVEQIVGIDMGSRKAIEVVDGKGRIKLERLGIFRRRFIERKYFLIANNSDIRNEAEGRVPTFELRDFERKWALGIDLSYLASCPPGNEAKLAESLSGGSHPGAVLNELITKWMKEFAGPDPGDLIEKYYSRKGELENHIAARASDETGLHLKAIVRISYEPKALEPIKIRPMHFPVRVYDYDEEQNVKLEAEVQVDPERKIYAVLHRLQIDRTEELITTKTQEYFATNVSLHRFHTELRSTDLKKELTNHLNSSLRPFGRRIGFVSLGGKFEEVDRAFFEAREKVEFDDIQEYEKKVVIKNIVQMNLKDYALYKNGGSRDLNTWIKENLTEIIKQVLFGKRYIDLLIGFEPLENEIKEKLSLRAEAIGYSIKQLITVPDLPPYGWLERFDLEIEKEFQTKMPKFPVRLGMVVTARIRKLQDVESFLNRRQDIPSLMEEMIIAETRQLLHQVDPERFYMRFAYTEREGEEPVEAILTNRITNRLVERFNAEVISVVLKMLDTDITARWAELEKGEGNLSINLPSFSDLEDVLYRGSFRVEAIHPHGWDRFRTANADIGKIQERLENHLLAKLGTLSNADLAYTNLEQQRKVEYIIERLAKEFVEEEFGIVIRINSVRREVTVQEKQEKERIIETLNAIAELEKNRISQITTGAPMEKIQNTEEKIRKLQVELPATVRATQANFKRADQLQSAGPTRVPDFFFHKSLTQGNGATDSNGDGGGE